MKEYRVSDTFIDSYAWSCSERGEELTSGHEVLRTFLYPDGTLAQDAQTPNRPTLEPPSCFRREQQLWRRFLAKHPICEFLLHYRCRRLRLWGPPNQLKRLLPEWTFSLSFPSRGLGYVSWTRVFQLAIPPCRKLFEELVLLLDAPVFEETKVLPEKLLFSGSHLLLFLETALEHVLRLGQAKGRWFEQEHAGSAFGFQRNQSQEGLCDTHWLQAASLLPKTFIFQPHQYLPEPNNCWRALYYNAGTQQLICYRRAARSYLAIHLEQPLYRYFKKMDFCGAAEAVVVKGGLYHIPAAILHG